MPRGRPKKQPSDSESNINTDDKVSTPITGNSETNCQNRSASTLNALIELEALISYAQTNKNNQALFLNKAQRMIRALKSQVSGIDFNQPSQTEVSHSETQFELEDYL